MYRVSIICIKLGLPCVFILEKAKRPLKHLQKLNDTIPNFL